MHYRDKLTVAKRLSISGLAVAYGVTKPRFLGPVPTVLVLDKAAGTLDVVYDDDEQTLKVKYAAGFEVNCV